MSTLIIPIGPPGSGKTTLKTMLSSNLNCKFYSSSRDDEYKKAIEIYKSKKKARRALFDTMKEFFNKIKAENNPNPIIYMDSCNAKKEIREKFIDDLKPVNVIFINFRYSDVDFLLQRTLKRQNHPTFPTDEEKQRETIKKCLSGICFEEEEGTNRTIINYE